MIVLVGTPVIAHTVPYTTRLLFFFTVAQLHLLLPLLNQVEFLNSLTSTPILRRKHKLDSLSFAFRERHCSITATHPNAYPPTGLTNWDHCPVTKHRSGTSMPQQPEPLHSDSTLLPSFPEQLVDLPTRSNICTPVHNSPSFLCPAICICSIPLPGTSSDHKS